MTTHILVKLFQSPTRVTISDRATGKEIGFIQSIKLIRKDLNIFRCRAKKFELEKVDSHDSFKIRVVTYKLKNNKVIFKTSKVEYEALVDFEGWPEAKNAKEIFVSIHSRSELRF